MVPFFLNFSGLFLIFLHFLDFTTESEIRFFQSCRPDFWIPRYEGWNFILILNRNCSEKNFIFNLNSFFVSKFFFVHSGTKFKKKVLFCSGVNKVNTLFENFTRTIEFCCNIVSFRIAAFN